MTRHFANFLSTEAWRLQTKKGEILQAGSDHLGGTEIQSGAPSLLSGTRETLTGRGIEEKCAIQITARVPTISKDACDYLQAVLLNIPFICSRRLVFDMTGVLHFDSKFISMLLFLRKKVVSVVLVNLECPAEIAFRNMALEEVFVGKVPMPLSEQ